MSRELLRAWKATLRRCGSRPAVTVAATGRVTTFRELDEAARAWLDRQTEFAAALRRRAVVFALPNSAVWFELFLGLLHAGAVIVPLDPGEPTAAQLTIAQTIRAGFVWDGLHLRTQAPARRFRDCSVCLIKVTSGSMGRPRPIPFTDRQMLADGRQVTATMGITRRDLNYAIIPLGHSYGLGNLTIPLVAQGIPVVIGSMLLPQAIAGEFARFRPTVLPGVPPIFRGLALADVAPAALASLRLPISAGAPLAPDIARAFARRFSRRIRGFYGSSETGGISYDRSGAGTLSGRHIGRALRGVRLRPLARCRLEICSLAVFTRGNRRRCGRAGCWVPADLALVGSDRNVRLLGRRGAVVKIAGRRVSLAGVAARLRRLTGVRDVWVGTGGGSDGALGAALAGDLSLEEVKRALRRDTPPWKTPKRWAVLKEFPVTPRGKTDRRALHRLVFG